MRFISLFEKPGATARARGWEKMIIKRDITRNAITPYVNMAEVNLLASSFLFWEINSEKIGINEVDKAPVIKI